MKRAQQFASASAVTLAQSPFLQLAT